MKSSLNITIFSTLSFLLVASVLITGGELKGQRGRINRLELKVDSLSAVVKQDTTRQRIDSLQTRLLHLEIWNEIFAEYYPWVGKEIKTREYQMKQDDIPAE